MDHMVKEQLHTSINRNIVECKGSSLRKPDNGFSSVLIETLWNVKFKHCFSSLVVQYRINRNIVECKDHIVRYPGRDGFVLIETLWNVKQLAAAVVQLHLCVLIKTLWNVKH